MFFSVIIKVLSVKMPASIIVAFTRCMKTYQDTQKKTINNGNAISTNF